MTQGRKTISLIVPFHDEAGGVSLFCDAVCAVFAQLPEYDFEVVCIDDGSSDRTLAGLMRVAERDPRFRIIEFSRNFGKEAALTAGMHEATGDALIPIDADLQDPPELIPDMVAAWRDGAEVVLARRADRSSDTFFKRNSAALFYRLHNRLSAVQIPENVGDFRLMDRAVVDALKQLPERHRFMKGLFAWVGFRTVTLDYVRKPRVADKSKFPGWKLWNFALEGITSFSVVPLRIWSGIGAIGALITFIYGLVIVTRTLLLGVDVPGYASLLVVVLFFGSVQLIGIGILGEYVGRTYMESKNRPLYIVRKRHGAKRGREP
ncbi:MAG: glycosyltransferase family 2 protein [Xanthomonadaceae bacterium]|jgi:glycosyltransferase involved in cell wall biosynthesis|nr:glycosyltransferase family 2 protein [Xanthomonadaceae bacterium]